MKVAVWGLVFVAAVSATPTRYMVSMMEGHTYQPAIQPELIPMPAEIPEPTPPPKLEAILALYNPVVLFLPDPIIGEEPKATLRARVYLVDEKENLITVDGELTVALYDEHPRTDSDGKPLPLERWKVTQQCLQQYISKDACGQGYDIALSWNTCRPDITSVEVEMRFTPAHGEPVVSQSGRITLRPHQKVP